MWRVAVTLLVLTGVFCAAGNGRAADDFAIWLAEFRIEASEKGISPATLDAALTGLEPLETVLNRDRRQPELKLTFETYSNRLLTPRNIKRGRAVMAEHAGLLQQVSERYGVQPRFIVAIWGIETRYGAVKGDTAVVPALATLAFDRRRSRFFRMQLLDALHMVDKGYIELADMKGSWAGAMGHPQFIPSSYLAFARDFDGDGRRDIWNNLGDVFASIANYLSQHVWADTRTWGREVQVTETIRQDYDSMVAHKAKGCRALRRATTPRRLGDWQAAGLRRLSGTALPAVDIDARLLMPDGAGGKAFLIYRNYESLLRYNCSNLYALTVGLLSDALGERR
ncbi:MAG: lytic murein transglycosylase [Alphaproteobacteria bacterium]|nr:lytic murein transglycosylase [Alphaproteobacteria bacterium]MCY4230519.1 lytic murein transglycosylase [Alphaproteobacteria bacterium]MCY4317653.1 lytic murein transglycosylase [Alphaproteobacteria bacterium]